MSLNNGSFPNSSPISGGNGQIKIPLSKANGGTGQDSSTGVAQNAVFAGPDSGGAGAASYRALVAADIPNHSAALLTSGTLPDARLSAVGSAGTYAYPASVTTDANGRITSVTAGSVITATAATSTLGSTFTIGADNAAYATTGLSVTLPSAGTYLVWYAARTNINATTTPGAYILLEMFNTTDGAAVANSEAIGAYGTTISAAYYGNATVPMVITVAASKTIALYAKVIAPSSTSTRTVNSDANGRTSMGYVKLAP